MHELLERLSEICAEKPLRKKVLVMPSISAGRALLQSYTLAGCQAINLHLQTVTGIALEQTAARLRREGLQLLPGPLAARLVQEIMGELGASGELRYFHTLRISPRIARAVCSALQELQEAGYGPGQITADKFVNAAKAADMRRIFFAYREKLREQGRVDRPGMLQLALQEQEHARPALPGEIILIPANLEVTPLEREFLSRHIRERSWASLSPGEVQGLKTPQGFFFEHHPADRPAGRPRPSLGAIYDPAPLPAETRPEVTFFHAYGPSAEVREVLRQLRRENFRLEDVAIFYTSREPYARLLFEETRRCGLPATFGEGIDVGCFGPGALFFALLQWIKTDFAVSVLYRLVESSAFRVDRTREPHKNALARELRGSGIVRGRERYLKWLREEPRDEGLAALLQELLAGVPAPDREGRVHPGALAGGLQGIMQRRCRVAGETDERAYSAITETLALVAQTPAEKTTLEEALEWLESLVLPLRVARSLPEAGSLYVDSYRRGIWTSRERVFIVVLDAPTFPGQAGEDPILLDVERDALSHRLKKYRFAPGEKLYTMAHLLAACSGAEGRVTLSFPSFDPVENRETSPSPLLLQVYRKVSGEAGADYSGLMEKLGPRKGFVPSPGGDALDPVEWWLASLSGRKKDRALRERVLERYPHLQRGLAARQQRESPRFTPHDGQIMPPGPLWKDGRFLSPGALEQLGRCPYSYFLRYVLQISPPEETDADPGRWLDPMARGSLLHEIFEAFYRQLLESGEEPSYVRHLELLESTGRELIAQQKEEQPPPHPVIFEHERQEILQSCRLFLRAEEAHAGESRPVYLELAFGLQRGHPSGRAGERDPVRLDLPSGRYLHLRGIIDRVDRVSADDSYVVLDYKTGSTYAYTAGGRFKGGRQLQHALYGLALEDLLQRQGRSETPPRIRDCGATSFPRSRARGSACCAPTGNAAGRCWRSWTI